MMRPNPFAEKESVPQRVPNDGEPTVFASPDRQVAMPPGALTVETKLHDRNRGLFAIVDGGKSPVGGGAASLTVAAELERQLGATLDLKLENLARSHASERQRPALREELVSQSMQLAFMEAHRRLMVANRENPNIRLRAQAAAARMVEVSPSQKELFFTLSGNERLYLVREGQAISRLGETGHAAMVAPGVLGEETPMTIVHRQALEPGDRLVLLGDGAVGVARGVNVEEVVKQFGQKGPRAVEKALQEFVKGRIEDPQNPDAKAGEISVVCWEAFPMAKKVPERNDNAVEMDARRPRLQVRLREIAQNLERARALSAPTPSGRELIGAKDTVVHLEAEQAAAELELLALDLPPRFKTGQEVNGWKITDVSGGKYYMQLVRGEQVRAVPRWDFESEVPAEDLPLFPNDRIRVEGFTARTEDDWRVMEPAVINGRVYFEDNAHAHQLAVPESKTRQALHDTLVAAKKRNIEAHVLARKVEKLRKGT